MREAITRVAVVGILALVPALAYPQNSADARIQKLEETIKTLEARIAALEAQLASSSVTPSAQPELVIWRKLKRGMSEREVRKLLGEPLRIDGGPVTYWRYSAGAEVYFMSSGLAGWTEPRR